MNPCPTLRARPARDAPMQSRAAFFVVATSSNMHACMRFVASISISSLTLSCASNLALTAPLTSFPHGRPHRLGQLSPKSLIHVPTFIPPCAMDSSSNPPVASGANPTQGSSLPAQAASASNTMATVSGAPISSEPLPEDVVSTNAVTAEAIARQNQTVVGLYACANFPQSYLHSSPCY